LTQAPENVTVGCPPVCKQRLAYLQNFVRGFGNSILLRVFIALAVGAMFVGATFQAVSEDTSSKTNSVTVKPPLVKAARRQLSGAELYSMHCNRCHPERYPTERTAAQWKTILMHMRVRANLPAEHARTILKYLQENSGR
jgi:hypothetical protein